MWLEVNTVNIQMREDANDLANIEILKEASCIFLLEVTNLE